VLHHLGDEGYLRVTAAARRACEELAAAIEAMPELSLRARPEATLLAFGATDPETLDVFAVADALWAQGWYVDRQGPPSSLHCTVNAVHDGKIPAFVADLQAAVHDVTAARAAGEQGAYGTVE
jgi:glutamate/tyrosine decarboxylase-like PLP-dependent enzyme